MSGGLQASGTPAAGVTVIRVSDISVSYGGRQVLGIDDFSVQAGECVGLFGNNGSGKSTLLRALVGLSPLDRGRIELGDRDVTSWPTHKRVTRQKVSYLPQRGIVFPELSVEENARLAPTVHGSRVRWDKVPQDIEAIVGSDDALIELWQRVLGRRHEFAGNLSGGERRALGLLLALRTKPDMLLLDEPLAGLSTKSAILGFVSKIHRAGMSILISEQNIRETLAIADRAVILKNGAVAYDGSTSELRSDPSRTLAIL